VDDLVQRVDPEILQNQPASPKDAALRHAQIFGQQFAKPDDETIDVSTTTSTRNPLIDAYHLELGQMTSMPALITTSLPIQVIETTTSQLLVSTTSMSERNSLVGRQISGLQQIEVPDLPARQVSSPVIQGHISNTGHDETPMMQITSKMDASPQVSELPAQKSSVQLTITEAHKPQP
jgi:hypothetical protein